MYTMIWEVSQSEENLLPFDGNASFRRADLDSFTVYKRDFFENLGSSSDYQSDITANETFSGNHYYEDSGSIG